LPSPADKEGGDIVLPTERIPSEPFDEPMARDYVVGALPTSPNTTVICGRRNTYVVTGSLAKISWRVPEISCSWLQSTKSGALFLVDKFGPYKIGVSVDGGLTWHVADLEPLGVAPALTASLDTDTVVFLDDRTTKLWSARARKSEDRIEIVLRRTGRASAGEIPILSAFFSRRRVCVPFQGLMICTEDRGDSWRANSGIAISHGVASASIWWGIDMHGSLMSCVHGDLQWKSVPGTERCIFDMVSATERSGWGLAACPDGPQLARLSGDTGEIAEWIRIPAFSYGITGQSFSSGEGGVALVTPCGAYVLEGHRLLLRLRITNTNSADTLPDCPDILEAEPVQ